MAYRGRSSVQSTRSPPEFLRSSIHARTSSFRAGASFDGFGFLGCGYSPYSPFFWYAFAHLQMLSAATPIIWATTPIGKDVAATMACNFWIIVWCLSDAMSALALAAKLSENTAFGHAMNASSGKKNISY